eukprot:TRINITY_DN7536_c0_g2_i1.p1 TRINITY_DN7536_c0_g2~~TRINITY_DN7536_c0_g2_i1.p1  ORF type:complete len:439 (+),score=104.31 TRINITY_DN7536_c0_g2_i1:94-1317(+)
MTANTFIGNDPHLNQLFSEFSNSWNNLASMVSAHKKKSLDPPMSFVVMHPQQQLSFSFLREDGNGIYLCAALEYLANIQNHFIDEILRLSEIEDSSFNITHFKAVTIQNIKKSDILQHTWKEGWLKFSQNGLNYGEGNNITYNFPKVVLQLSHSMISQIHFVVMDYTRFSYVHELFNSNRFLLDEVSQKISQHPLITDIQIAISKAERTQLLSFLGVLNKIIYFLKQTGGSGDQLIGDYITTFIASSGYFPELKDLDILLQIPLKCIVPLFHYVEEVISKECIFNLTPTFKVPLVLTPPEKYVSFFKENPSLIHVLSVVLCRFAFRYLMDTIVLSLDQYLNHFLLDESLWPFMGSAEIPLIKRGIESLPNIKVCQIYEFYGYLQKFNSPKPTTIQRKVKRNPLLTEI